MKIHILAVGKLDAKAYTELEQDYLKRIQRSCPVSIQEVPEPGGKFNNADEVVKRYSTLLEKAIKGRPFVLCDQRGRAYDSIEFAGWLKAKMEQPPAELVIVIGGSHGVSEALADAARECIAFSRLTFPHQLFRILLLEQLYRGFSIIEGSKYHK